MQIPNQKKDGMESGDLVSEETKGGLWLSPPLLLSICFSWVAPSSTGKPSRPRLVQQATAGLKQVEMITDPNGEHHQDPCKWTEWK